MKKFLPLLLGVALLAGCAKEPGQTTGAPSPISSPQSTAEKVKQTITKVQSYTRTACGFIPTVATITGLFNAGVGESVGAIGGAICDAITSNPMAEGDVPGYYKSQATVNGVVIEGRYVKRR